MKKYLYIFYILAILICYLVLKSHKSKGFIDVTGPLLYAGIAIALIALIATVLTPSSFGLLKKIMVTLSVGVGIVVFVIMGFAVYDNYQSNQARKKYLAKIEEQKTYYGNLNLLEGFSVEHIKQDTVLNAVHAYVDVSKKILNDDWKAQLIVFVKPKRHHLLLKFPLYKSESISIPLQGTLEMSAKSVVNDAYRYQLLQEQFGDTLNLEYLLLLKKSEITRSRGLAKGIAYTSLADSIVKKRHERVSVISKNYFMTNSPKMLANQKINLKNIQMKTKAQEE